jgi:hypothetical protein
MAVLVLARRNKILLDRFTRPAVLLGAIFLFLVAGRILGGAPTHHDARPLLPIIWALAMVIACWLFDDPRAAPATDTNGSDPRGPRRGALVVVMGAAACGSLIRFERSPEPYAARAAELAIGEEAKRRLGDGDRLLVETGDYGFFAIIAAFGAPERAEPFDRHDPRDPPAVDAFASPAALRSRLAARGATWFIVPRGDRTIVANEGGAVAEQNDAYVLFRTAAAAEHR